MLNPLFGAGGTSPSTPPGRMGPHGQAQLCEPPRCAGRDWRGNSSQMCDSGKTSAMPCLHLGLDVPLGSPASGCSFASLAPRVPRRGAGGAMLRRRWRGTRGDAPSLGSRQQGCEQPLVKGMMHGDGCLGFGSAGQQCWLGDQVSPRALPCCLPALLKQHLLPAHIFFHGHCTSQGTPGSGCARRCREHPRHLAQGHLAPKKPSRALCRRCRTQPPAQEKIRGYFSDTRLWRRFIGHVTTSLGVMGHQKKYFAWLSFKEKLFFNHPL